MDSGLVIKSANSWDSGIHRIMFQRLRYVQVLQVIPNLIFSYSERDFAPPGPVLWTKHLRGVGREVTREDRGKMSASAFSSCQPCLPDELHLLQPSSSGWHTCRSPSWFSWHPLPSSAPTTPWPSQPHLYTTRLCSYTLSMIPVPSSTIPAFNFCPWVQLAGPNTATQSLVFLVQFLSPGLCSLFPLGRYP